MKAVKYTDLYLCLADFQIFLFRIYNVIRLVAGWFA